MGSTEPTGWTGDPSLGPGKGRAERPTLRGRTLFITGASRGIGKAIGLRAAADGANVVVAAKTDQPHPRLPGTIHTAVREMEAAGGRGLAVQVDIRDEAQVRAAVDRAVEVFGGVDILVNNASAIFLAGTADTPMKRYDLMFDVNVRGTFLCTQALLPHLQGGTNPHVLNLAPPPSLDSRWFRDHVAYTISKYGMSLCVLGMAEEFRESGVAVNALWPRTLIATAALSMLEGGPAPENCRRPEIVADAAHAILCRSARTCTGNFFLDEEVLREVGVTDFHRYAVAPGRPLLPDLFVGE
jgi:citronellol/citronellal dehydrogenase